MVSREEHHWVPWCHAALVVDGDIFRLASLCSLPLEGLGQSEINFGPDNPLEWAQLVESASWAVQWTVSSLHGRVVAGVFLVGCLGRHT